MRPCGVLFAAALLLCLLGRVPANAEYMVEVWRSPLGDPRFVAINTADGSSWATFGDTLVHAGATGARLSQTGGLSEPRALSVDPDDGSCWVADALHGRFVHFAADGTQVWEGTGYASPWSVAVDPTDGSCWGSDAVLSVVYHFAADGSTIWSGDAFDTPLALGLNPADRSVWVANSGANDLIHQDRYGQQQWEGGSFTEPYALAVSPVDGSCWVADDAGGKVSHLVFSGSGEDEDWTVTDFTGFSRPISVAADADGSVWVADVDQRAVIHLSSTGAELSRTTNWGVPCSVASGAGGGWCIVADYNGILTRLAADGSRAWGLGGYTQNADDAFASSFAKPDSISVDPNDGSVWVGDLANGQVVHLAADGTQLWRGAGFNQPRVGVSPAGGSCWIADLGNARVVHLAAGGGSLWSGGTLTSPISVAPDASDGSCWVADFGGRVVRIAANGDEAASPASFAHPWSVSLSAVDRSLRVVDPGSNQLISLAADGHEMWRVGGLDSPSSVAVDAGSGTCWVADTGSNQVLRFSATGSSAPAVAEMYAVRSVSVDPHDGSCWAALSATSEVVHLSAQGEEKWRGGDFSYPWSVSVSATDGSCWVADQEHGQVVHLAPLSFVDVPPDFWAYREVEACANAGIVAGYWDGYHPDETVSRAQMAVFIARSLAGGDDDVHVPTGVTEPSFADVPADYWAYRYIEYCKGANIVAGYWDGYHPEDTVTRAQMAVYAARSIVDPTGEACLAGYTPPATASFPDVPTDYWAYKHIEYCKAQSIVAGYWDGYHPEETVNRAQMAVYVARAFDLPM